MTISELKTFENELVLVTMSDGSRHAGRFRTAPGRDECSLVADASWPGSEQVDAVGVDAIAGVIRQN